LLAQAVAAPRADVAAWLGLAQARAMLGDSDGKAAAIDAALAQEPSNLRALIAKADHLAQGGDLRAAAAFYGAALQHLPRAHTLTQDMRAALQRAQRASAQVARSLEEHVRAGLEEKGLGPAQAPARFTDAVDMLFGRKRRYAQEPRYLFYPELPLVEFYPRDQLPWLDAIEDGAADIARDLAGVRGSETFAPYVTQAPDRPRNAQLGMAGNPDWGGFFLVKEGTEQAGAERCAQTMALLQHIPLTRIPRRAPAVLFSRLAAGAHIPAHTGMLNARLVCHLPLVVPEGCTFRVGNSVRPWVAGQAWAFDDTIEHEAWNRSAADRFVLIFDVWRPELAAEEREGIVALCDAIDSFGGAVSWAEA
jgi:hypothetical protein